VHRVIQPVGVIFKGSGFYVTDNKGKSSTGIPAGKKEDVATAAPATTTTETKTESSANSATVSSTASNTKKDG